MTPDLSQPLLYALLDNAAIVAQLPPYKDSVSIFTRRPPPTDASYPMIIVSPDVVKVNYDGYSDQRPCITRDVAVYGLNDSSDNYRTVENIANNIFDLFHRNRASLLGVGGVDDWVVVDVESHGPIPAPVDDDMYVGRIVSLHVWLARMD